MEYKISKELLGEVLGLNDINSIYDTAFPNIIEYTQYANMARRARCTEINIYELAHKCKEWALKQGMLIRSSIDGVVDFYDFTLNGDDKGEFIDCLEFKCYEQEAIFKACQLLLDNKDKKNENDLRNN